MEQRGTRRQKKGVVLSNKMNKTVIVQVDTTFRHPKYKKVITRGKKYYAHDESNVLEIGKTVTIQESRPYSKLKRWLVVSSEN